MGYIVEVYGVPTGRIASEHPNGSGTFDSIAAVVDRGGVRFGDMHYSSSSGDKFRGWLDTVGGVGFADRFLYGPIGDVTVETEDDFPVVGGIPLAAIGSLIGALSDAAVGDGDEQTWQDELLRVCRYAIDRNTDLICITR